MALKVAIFVRKERALPDGSTFTGDWEFYRIFGDDSGAGAIKDRFGDGNFFMTYLPEIIQEVQSKEASEPQRS